MRSDKPQEYRGTTNLVLGVFVHILDDQTGLKTNISVRVALCPSYHPVEIPQKAAQLFSISETNK